MNSAQTIETTTPVLANWEEIEEGTVSLFEIGSDDQSPAIDRFPKDMSRTCLSEDAEDELVTWASGLSDKAMTRRVLAAALIDSDLRERLSAIRIAANQPFREGGYETAPVQALYESLLTLTWETARGVLPVAALSRMI